MNTQSTPEDSGRTILAICDNHGVRSGGFIQLHHLLEILQGTDLNEGLRWLVEKGFIDMKGSKIGPYYLTEAGFKEI